MPGADGTDPAVKAKVLLVDPRSMRVVWMNEAAAQDAAGDADDEGTGIPLESAMPLSVTLGVADALPGVAETGRPTHLRTGLVSTVRGSVSIVLSAYRLPDGMLLLVSENAWQPSHGKPEGGTPRRPGRRR